MKGSAIATVNDLRALRWSYLGNVRRIQSDFRCAEDAFTLAESFFDLGSSDPLLRAELYDLKASLRRDQARLDEARSLLNRAANIYRRTGDDQNGKAQLSGESHGHISSAMQRRGLMSPMK